MLPLAAEGQTSFTVLISLAISVLVPGGITLAVKLFEIRQKRRENKDGAPKAEAETDKTKADTGSVEADIWTKALQGQGTVVQQLLTENARAYDRAKEAEDKATAADEKAQAAQESAEAAREEIAELRREMEAEHADRLRFEFQIEGYLIQHKVGLPEWWPRHHRPDGGAKQ